MPVATVLWPSAPLTVSLVKNALQKALPDVQILDLSTKQESQLIRWSSYDEIDHELVNLHREKTLSSSYTFRKSLIRKHFLSRCITSYLVKNPESFLKHAWPRTYEIEISFADELDEIFSDELWELGEALENTESWWILKPLVENIFQEFEEDSEDEDETAENEENTGIIISQLRHFVIQQYVSGPALFDPHEVPLNGFIKPPPEELRGHKFHLRAYCVASGALTVYLYDRILALFSSEPYKRPSSDEEVNLAAHLTNTSLQTHRGEEGVRLLDELVGCHVLSTPEGTNRTFTKEDVTEIASQMRLTLEETFNAALNDPINFQPLPNAFELFGIDFLVEHRQPLENGGSCWQVKLLEVNAEPAIELTGPRLKWILEDLFVSMARVCVQPFASGPATAGVSQWPVGVSQFELTKCLHKEVRGSMGT